MARKTRRATRSHTQKLALLAAGILPVLSPVSTFAGTPNWNLNPSTPGDWFNANNWFPLVVPGPNDTATIGNGGTSQISSGSASVQSLTVGGTAGSAIVVSAGQLTTDSLTINSASSGGASFTQTGGTVTLPPIVNEGIFTIGSTAGAGAYTISGGTLSASELDMTSGSGLSSSFNMSGTAQVFIGSPITGNSFGESGAGSLTMNQTGGTFIDSSSLFIASGTVNQSNGSRSDVSMLLGGAAGTTYNLSGGTHVVGTLEINPTSAASGTYAISGSGRLTETDLVMYYAAKVAQTAGSNSAGSMVFNGGIYALSGGALSATSLSISSSSSPSPVFAGILAQSGGAAQLGSVLVTSSGSYQLTGGTLAISNALTVDGGTLDFGAASGTLTLGTNSTPGAGLNLSNAQILNSSKASLVILGSNSIAVFPAGFNPATAFASYSNAGITHVTGTPLNISASESVQFVGNFNDHVQDLGSLAAPANQALNLTNGIQVSGSGVVNLGTGTLIVADTVSGISGGQLSAALLSITGANSGDSFTQTGGAVTLTGVVVQNNLNYSVQGIKLGAGTYSISGGTLSLAGLTSTVAAGAFKLSGSGQVSIASGGSLNQSINLTAGTISQTGGTMTASGSLSIGGTCNQSGGLCTETTPTVVANGVYNLSGGTHSVTTLAINGTYNLSGTGQLNASLLEVNTGGLLAQIGGSSNPVMMSCSGGTCTMTGGTLSAVAATVGQSSTSTAGIITQTGGTAQLGSLVVSTGGTYRLQGGVLAGGKLTISNALTVDGGALDFQGTSEVLTIGSGSSGAGVNLSNAQILNSSATSLNINGSNSITIFPTGFNPTTAFASYSNAGITHIAGTTLVVPAGFSTQFAGNFNDHIQAQGTLSAAADQILNLNQGVEVTGTGAVNLGLGSLNVADTVSKISGGQISAGGMTVSSNAGGAVFTQTGGSVTLVGTAGTTNFTPQVLVSPLRSQTAAPLPTYNSSILDVGSPTGTGSGTYSVSGGSLVVGALTIASAAGSTGVFNLSGTGQVSANYMSFGEGGAVMNQTGGSIATFEFQVPAGTCNQSGGSRSDANFDQFGPSAYNLSGGTHSVDSFAMDADSTYTLRGTGQLIVNNLQTGGTIVQSGGSCVAGAVACIGGSYSQSGGILSATTFSIGQTPGGAPVPGAFTQTGGTAQVGALTVTTGGTDHLTGGALIVTGALTIDGGAFDMGAGNSGQSLTASTLELINGGTLTHANQSISVQQFFNTSGGLVQNTGVLSAQTVGIGGGTTQINGGGRISAAFLAVSGGSVVAAGGATAGVLAVGTGGMTMNGAGGANITLIAGAAAGSLVLAGDVDCSLASGTDLIVSGTVSAGQLPGFVDLGGVPRTFTVDRGTAASDLTVSARVTDGQLVKLGAGILRLSSTANDFAGGLAVHNGTVILAAACNFTGDILADQSGTAAGTVQVDSDAELGSSSNTITLAGGALSATATFATSRSLILGAPYGDGAVSVSAGKTFTLNADFRGRLRTHTF